MKCPIDTGVDLLMSERNGIEIDYCPSCRGVWLDRGELDKIIDRAAPSTSSTAPAPSPVLVAADDRRGDRDDRRGDRGDQRHIGDAPSKKRKRESFLGDLFDF